jgi:hypothetical protein
MITCRVTYKTGCGFGDWIYCTLCTNTTRDYRQYGAVAILHTFQLTVTHPLGFSVFTSRIVATDLSQSHCTWTHTWSLLVTVYLLSCYFFSITVDNHLQNSTQFSRTTQFERPSLSLYSPSARTTQKTQPLSSNGLVIVGRVRFRGNVFAESLPSNGSRSQNNNSDNNNNNNNNNTSCGKMLEPH